MSINDLIAVLPAPSHPFEVPAKDEWMRVEGRLGTTLPNDYKQFIEKYGTGKIDDFLWIFNPVSKNGNVNLLEQVRVQLNVLTELGSYREIVPYKLFPEQGGILPFAITDNGDVLFWKLDGEPNRWTVIVNEARSPEWANFNMSMNKFLLEILTRQLSCNIFSKSFPSLAPMFEAS